MTTEPDGGFSSAQSARDHVGFKMASGAGVDLHRRRAGSPNALAIVRRRLIAFDDIELQFVLQIADGALQQRGLAGARRTDEIERENLPAREPGPVLRRQGIVLGEDARLQLDHGIGGRAG